MARVANLGSETLMARQTPVLRKLTVNHYSEHYCSIAIEFEDVAWPDHFRHVRATRSLERAIDDWSKSRSQSRFRRIIEALR